MRRTRGRDRLPDREPSYDAEGLLAGQMIILNEEGENLAGILECPVGKPIQVVAVDADGKRVAFLKHGDKIWVHFRLLEDKFSIATDDELLDHSLLVDSLSHEEPGEEEEDEEVPEPEPAPGKMVEPEVKNRKEPIVVTVDTDEGERKLEIAELEIAAEGWMVHLPNGEVEVFLKDQKSALDEFLRKLKEKKKRELEASFAAK